MTFKEQGKMNGHVMHQQFNIQKLYALPTLYLCVLYLSENKQRLVPPMHKLIGFYNRDERCLQRGTDWGYIQSGLSFVCKGLISLLLSNSNFLLLSFRRVLNGTVTYRNTYFTSTVQSHTETRAQLISYLVTSELPRAVAHTPRSLHYNV